MSEYSVSNIVNTMKVLYKTKGIRNVIQNTSSVVVITEDELKNLLLKNLMAMPSNIHSRYLEIISQILNYGVKPEVSLLRIEECSVDNVHENEMERLMDSATIMYTDDDLSYTIYVGIKAYNIDIQYMSISTEIQIVDKPEIEETDKFENQIYDILTKYRSLSSSEFDKLFDVGMDVVEKSSIYKDKNYEALTPSINDSDIKFCEMLNIKPSELTSFDAAMKIIKLIFPAEKMSGSILDREIERYWNIKCENKFVEILNELINKYNTSLVLRTQNMTPVAFQKIDQKLTQAILGGGYSVYINDVTNKLIDFMEILDLSKTTLNREFIEFIIDNPVIDTNYELDDIVVENKNNFVTVNVKLKKSN